MKAEFEDNESIAITPEGGLEKQFIKEILKVEAGFTLVVWRACRSFDPMDGYYSSDQILPLENRYITFDLDSAMNKLGYVKKEEPK